MTLRVRHVWIVGTLALASIEEIRQLQTVTDIVQWEEQRSPLYLIVYMLPCRHGFVLFAKVTYPVPRIRCVPIADAFTSIVEGAKGVSAQKCIKRMRWVCTDCRVAAVAARTPQAAA